MTGNGPRPAGWRGGRASPAAASEPKAAEGIGYRHGGKSCPARTANAAHDTFSDGLEIIDWIRDVGHDWR
jgi:hypothetical protein